MTSTEGEDYARRLVQRGGARWKRLLNVQAPYQWNLRRHDLGATLDVGCGIGRNLRSLPPGSLGVDHNRTSVEVARAAGLDAMTTDEFLASDRAKPEAFDGLLFAHVIEHMPQPDSAELVRSYLRYLKPGGKALFICPQERGYASDPTHVQWTTGEDLVALATSLGLLADGWTSFPFPRFVGKLFPYNEFTVVARKPAARTDD